MTINLKILLGCSFCGREWEWYDGQTRGSNPSKYYKATSRAPWNLFTQERGTTFVAYLNL